MLLDEDKTKEQLINELAGLRQRVAELEKSETERKQAEEKIQQQNEFLNNVLESLTHPFCVIDANDYTIKIANPAAKLGNLSEKPTCYVLTHRSSTPCGGVGHVCPLENVKKTRKPAVVEHIHYDKDGKPRNVEVHGYLIFDTKGNVTQMIEYSLDITERKQAEEALRESEAKYRGLVTHVKLGVFRSTPEPAGRFLEVNPAMVEITGYSRKELLQMNVSDLYVYPEERGAVLEEIASGMGKPAKELHLRKKDGTEIVVLDRKVAVRDDAGQILYFDGIMEDITERKRAEERERELQQELSLSSRLAAIGELAAGVAHEINNPLTGILGFSQRLMRKSTDEEVSWGLEIIHNEALRAAKIVENLQTFARPREPKKEYSDINDIVQKAVELRDYELKTGNIEVVTDLAPSLRKTMVDFHQIQEVFLNIILNAEQVMTEANGGGKLSIKTQRGKDCIRISFADDGPGISAENLDKLFDPFFTTRGERGGTGLGLSVCHGIITEHGGRIYAKSKPGKGATFFVELPCPQL